MVLLHSQTGKPVVAAEVKWSDRHTDNPDLLKKQIDFCRKNGLKTLYTTSRTRAETKSVEGIQITYITTFACCYMPSAIALFVRKFVGDLSLLTKPIEIIANMLKGTPAPTAPYSTDRS